MSVTLFSNIITHNVLLNYFLSTDSDGDLITISSDEELVESLSHFDGVLFKLYLLKSKQMLIFVIVASYNNYFYFPENTASNTANGEGKPAGQQHQQPQGQRNGPNRRHWGVVCDGCSGPVIGVRYKCLVCDDYDLCSSCEGRGVHVDHNMVTITEPRWGRGCGPWGGRRGPQRCHGASPWGPPTGLGGCPFVWGAPSSTGKACGGDSSKQPEPMETDQPAVTEEQKEHIRNIGKFVSNFLQPFGIKVDVDTTGVENKDTQAEEKQSSAGATVSYPIYI